MSFRSEVVRIVNELLAGSKKISQLSAGAALDGTELVEVVQNGTNVQTTTQDIADLGGGGGGGTWGSITGTLSNQTDLSAALNLKFDSLITFNTQTGDYTLQAADLTAINAGDNLIIEMNVAGANSLTIPLNATVAFPVGTQILVKQIGAGATTVVATGGVTITGSSGTLVSPGQNALMALIKKGTDTWYLENGGPSPVSGNGVVWSGSGLQFNLGALSGNVNLSGAFALGRGVSPTALFHLGAGTGSANFAPLKFTDGTQLATSEPLVVEPATGGENLLFTNQANTFTKVLLGALVGSGTLNFPSIAANGGVQTLTITVTGAGTGDEVLLGIPTAAITAGVVWFAYVNATNSVTVVATNCTTGALDPGSGVFKVAVIKR